MRARAASLEKSSPSRIRTQRDLAEKNEFPQLGGPKSGPAGGEPHQAAPASMGHGLEGLASQFASLSQADWATLLAMMLTARQSSQ